MKEKKINSLEDLIKYLFYVLGNKLSFGFNETWDIEEDKKISKKLKIKLRNLCPNLMDDFKK